MDYPLELNKANRLKLAQVFRNHPRVDCSIDCVIEGQMGAAFVDDLASPQAYRITIGPFWYFGGEANSPGGVEMMKNFPPYNLLMASAPGWVELAQETFGERLQPFTRYSFSAQALSPEHLESVLEGTGQRERLGPIGEELAAGLKDVSAGYFDIEAFDSPADFAGRGLGFAALAGEQVMGVAYASLVFSRALEVSIYVEEPYRRQGVATALGAQLALAALQRGLLPNWDAANPESCRLAEKLGFIPTGTYEAYFYRPA